MDGALEIDTLKARSMLLKARCTVLEVLLAKDEV